MLQTRECLDEIADLFQSGSGEIGAELVERVTDLYFVTADQQSVEDLDAFGDVMIRMAFAGDALTRARLAERISRAESAPKELLRRLACDEILVARPVLQYSPCLREGDLISILGQVQDDHMVATSHRPGLTPPVTDFLLARGGKLVFITIAGNMGAQFSPEGLENLTKAAQNCSEMQLLLSLRPDFAPGPLRRLKRLAEAEFWQKMAESILMTEENLEVKNPGKPKPENTKEIQLDPDTSVEPAKDSNNTGSAERKTTSSSENALFEAAKSENIEETLKHFSSITRLNETMLEHCLFEAHITALMVLCKANKLAPGTFRVLLQLKESHADQPLNDTLGLLRRYDGMTPDTAQRIMRFSDKRQKLDDPENAPPQEGDKT